jgi:MAF protein
MKIILASTSVNRKSLFDRLEISYEIMAPECDEIVNPKLSPEENLKNFAFEKSQSVYKKVDQDGDVCVIGFDSMVLLEGELIGKAKTKKVAFEMLQNFRGKKQSIVTGVSLVGRWQGECFERTEIESTDVYFRADTTNCQIRDYLEFEDWAGKCGAYSILGMGIFLIEKIEGDFQNIVGVPVLKMGEMIREITGKNPLKVFMPISNE